MCPRFSFCLSKKMRQILYLGSNEFNSIKSIILIVLMLILITGCTGSKKYKLETKKYTFQSLTENQKPERKVYVVLPPDYAKQGNDERYPTIYLLQGYGSSLKNAKSLAKNVKTKSNILYNIGKIQKMIVVVPHLGTQICEPGNFRYGSFYRNSEITGHFKDLIFNELISNIDNDFRTIATREKRSIVGFSMGGYGAMMLAMESNIELGDESKFSIVSAHSGPLSLEHEIETLANYPQELNDFKPIAECLLKGMEAAFANGEQLGLEIGFGNTDVNEEVLNKWLANDALTYLNENGAVALQNMAINIDSGETDELGVKVDAELFSQKLDELNINHSFEIYKYDWTPIEWLNNLLSGHGFIAERIPLMLQFCSNHF